MDLEPIVIEARLPPNYIFVILRVGFLLCLEGDCSYASCLSGQNGRNGRDDLGAGDGFLQREGRSGLFREPAILVSFEQDDDRDRGQARDLGHVLGESEATGRAGLEIDDDGAGGQGLEGLGRGPGIIHGDHPHPIRESETDRLLDVGVVRDDEKDSRQLLSHCYLGRGLLVSVVPDLFGQGLEQAFDIDIEPGLEALKAAQYVDKLGSGSLGPRNRLGQNRRVMPAETSPTEGAAPRRIGFGSDLGQQEGPVTGVAGGLDLHVFTSLYGVVRMISEPPPAPLRTTTRTMGSTH